jgi:hypothetical protein
VLKTDYKIVLMAYCGQPVIHFSCCFKLWLALGFVLLDGLRHQWRRFACCNIESEDGEKTEV